MSFVQLTINSLPSPCTDPGAWNVEGRLVLVPEKMPDRPTRPTASNMMPSNLKVHLLVLGSSSLLYPALSVYFVGKQLLNVNSQ